MGVQRLETHVHERKIVDFYSNMHAEQFPSTDTYPRLPNAFSTLLMFDWGLQTGQMCVTLVSATTVYEDLMLPYGPRASHQYRSQRA